jgi:hypothetical protein
MTFASNLATGDVIDFVQILGNVLDIGAPSDDTVTAAKINNDVISGQTALTSAPADTDELMISDAGTIKRIDVSLIKGLDGVTTGSGNVTITDGDLIFGGSGHGIYLGVTSATAANHLDDYEEGTWTASLTGSASYTTNTGYYRKIGNLVYITLYFTINSYTSGNRVNMQGLPFTSAQDPAGASDGHHPISCTRFNNVHENVLAVYPMVSANSAQIKCDTMNSAGSSITSNNVEFFGNNTIVRFAGCYPVAT